MQLSQAALRDDLAQLVRVLAESHPDPFSAGGGAVAFYRRADDVAAALPAEGLDDAAFLRRLRPLVAAIGDGHTAFFPLAGALEVSVFPRLVWDVVGDDLYVVAVAHEEDRGLLGARLAAAGDVPVDELAERLGHIRGCDNEYQLLSQLALALNNPTPLAEVLQAEEVPSRVQLGLLLPGGARSEAELTWDTEQPGAMIRPPSAIAVPVLNAARMGWGFLDARGEVACLRVATLRHYREAFEVARATGFAGVAEDRLANVAREALGGHLPESAEERLAAVPSATELLGEMFAAMREARSSSLIVDLRECDGGNSFFAGLLGSFLYGGEAQLRTDEGYQVKRYSPLYFANYRNASPEDFPEAMLNGGYDFAEERAWLARRRGDGSPTMADREEQRRFIAMSPTFAREYAARDGKAVWTPRVVVLTSAWTYSAGFDVVTMLLRNGADVVGVPSAQAGNCFIDVLRFRLEHSGLAGWISFKWSQAFPGDPERGRVLRPVRELTYAELVARDFDPHASVAVALDYLQGDRSQ
jgi:hypothetical protein